MLKGGDAELEYPLHVPVDLVRPAKVKKLILPDGVIMTADVMAMLECKHSLTLKHALQFQRHCEFLATCGRLRLPKSRCYR